MIQAAINDGVLCILVWQTYRWRPRLRFHGGLLANVFAFSASVVLTQVMFTILTRIQDMIIARFISAPAVGVYRVAWRLNSLIVQTTIQPLADISLVTFAQLQDDRERFRGAYLRMLGLSAFFTLPALFGLGFLSDEVIALLFGPKWDGAGDVVKILRLWPFLSCSTASGATRWLLWGALPQSRELRLYRRHLRWYFPWWLHRMGCDG